MPAVVPAMRPNTAPMVALAHAIRNAANSTYDIAHPEIPEIRDATHVLFFLPPLEPGGPTRDMVVMPTGAVDRSPCGTGTTSKVATLTARGELEFGAPFTHISPIGSTFTGQAIERLDIGGLPGCRVAITGSAFITADSTLYVNSADELAGGFQLS